MYNYGIIFAVLYGNIIPSSETTVHYIIIV
jgi:hypothetical protein